MICRLVALRTRRSQEAAVSVSLNSSAGGGNSYVIEWAIDFMPCIQLQPGVYYAADMPPVSVGLNIALGDVDTPDRSYANKYGLFHEQWFNGTNSNHTNLWQFGTLWLLPMTMHEAVAGAGAP